MTKNLLFELFQSTKSFCPNFSRFSLNRPCNPLGSDPKYQHTLRDYYYYFFFSYVTSFLEDIFLISNPITNDNIIIYDEQV